jgi:hypothetical protein
MSFEKIEVPEFPSEGDKSVRFAVAMRCGERTRREPRRRPLSSPGSARYAVTDVTPHPLRAGFPALPVSGRGLRPRVRSSCDGSVAIGLGGGAGLVLIAPFPKRAHGLTPAEVALVQAVAGHLRNRSTAPDGPCWIDASTGSTTPAAIGEGQLRRRLIDCASFEVRAVR